MTSPIGWWWPLTAGVATAVAFAAGPSYAIAVPAATVAVVAAALTLVEAVWRRRDEARPTAYVARASFGSIREAFNGGEPGREDIVMALDLLERKFSRPDLPTRTAAELHALVDHPEDDFRRYVAERLDTLEGPP